MTEPEPPRSERHKAAAFATTHWSLVVRAGEGSSPAARQALGALFSTYWYPLYAFARRRGLSVENAQDLTQGFFTQVLDKSYFENADPDRGRFRSFLLTMFKRFLSNQRDRANAAKRGGNVVTASLELPRFDFESGEKRYSVEPIDTQTPERLFERRWALTLLEHVMAMLEKEYSAKGKAEFFQLCRHQLVSGNQPQRNSANDNSINNPTTAPQTRPLPNSEMNHSEIARKLGVNENALSVAIHRMKQRYRKHLVDEIRQTLADPDDLDSLKEELAQLRSVLS